MTEVSRIQLLNCIWEDGLRGWHSREAHNTHTQNQKSLYGAGTKGLFAQWPFALQWGVAGMLGPEQGHKHQSLEPSTEGGGSIHMSVCVHAVWICRLQHSK